MEPIFERDFRGQTQCFRCRTIRALRNRNGWKGFRLYPFPALEKSKPIGAARLQKYGKIERVSVLREYRSKGIGTAIMKRVIESAMDLSVEKIYLHSQMDSKNFYQQLGFIELGQIFYEANIPHIEMILK